MVGPPTIVTPAAVEELAEQLAAFRIKLVLDGEIVAEGGGDAVLGSPLNALAHLIEVLQDLPDHPPLEAGELITTGTLTQALPAAANQRWSTRIEGLPVTPLTLRLR
jgi:2-oxo-3-hexenedioate decarboxylase